MSMLHKPYVIGMMTGTSLDGLDAVLADFAQTPPTVLASVALDYPCDLKADMLALQANWQGDGINELHRSRVAGIQLAQLHARAAQTLLDQSGLSTSGIAAIGVHGQTVRHAPSGAQGSALGYTVQLIDPSTLAESTGCTVVSDFRSRDIAAGGQGAPLVPAFHKALCDDMTKPACVVNIGGFANVTLLRADGDVQGFDTGPGNVLMDAWAQASLGKPYDADGSWAASGTLNPALLTAFLAHPYFASPLPKSTGREAFDLAWLQRCMACVNQAPDAIAAVDVQATLCELTARTIAQAVAQHQPDCRAVYVCGGGAFNAQLMSRLRHLIPAPVHTTQALGVAPQHMEALAFAWLAKQCLSGLTSNVPAVTGAKGTRVLGVITPA